MTWYLALQSRMPLDKCNPPPHVSKLSLACETRLMLITNLIVCLTHQQKSEAIDLPYLNNIGALGTKQHRQTSSFAQFEQHEHKAKLACH